MSENTIAKSSILIVDDEQEHAQVMCEALQRIGHKCDVSYNLAEAQARLNRKNYDVIVTDLMMDGRKDGLEVLRRAKTMTPPPPVLLVTDALIIATHCDTLLVVVRIGVAQKHVTHVSAQFER